MSERKFKYVGTRPIRPDGVDKVTGRANYGADFTAQGLLHGVVLRSPHAHARIVSIDTKRAAEMRGVKAVITADDLPDLPKDLTGGIEGHVNMRDLTRNCMARDKVLYHGHAVAAVAAKTRELALAASREIDVTYDVLEPVLDIDSAISSSAPILHEGMHTKDMTSGLSEAPSNIASRIEFRKGDVDAAFAEAEVIVEREFTTPMIHQGYIEPHAVVARVGEDEQIVIWVSTQGGFLVREYTAALLEVETAKIKVIPSEIGGGFGGKTTIYQEPLAAVLARKSGRPVKMVMSREEVFRATGPTSGSKMLFKLGAKRDGTITAASASIYMEAGAYAGGSGGAAAMCAYGPYVFPNFFVEAYDVVLNKPKVAAYRAPGAPMGALGVECLIDELASKLEMDPIDLRLANAVQEGDTSPVGAPYGPIGLRETLEEAKRHPHYKAPLGPNQGRGVACGYWFNAGMQSSANVCLHEDGSVSVSTGNPDIGGWRASMALIVAEELGVPYERVRPVISDTDTVGYTDLTGGSRTTVVTGAAIIKAVGHMVDELRSRAAQIWDVELDAVGWKEGRAVGLNGAGDREPLSLKELAAEMGSTGGPILTTGSVVPGTTGPSFGTHLCDIEVDPETGVSRVARYTVIQDVGKAVHPSYVEGQMQGGATQGIGWALNEEYIFDENGVMENPGFLDYRMPLASDLPMIDTVMVEVANTAHPYGARGVGEIPIVPPLAAVTNAMSHAVGVRFADLPLSPPRVLSGIQNGG